MNSIRVKAALSVFLSTLVWLTALGPALAGSKWHSVATRDGARPYLIYVPDNLPASRPVPLVLMLHGGGGRAEGVMHRYNWPREADARGFAVAFPQGTPTRRGRGYIWNEGSGRGPAGERNVDDVGYIRAVIDDIARRRRVDLARVYATGFSMGASMTHRLGAELAGRLAAVAPVSGHNWLAAARPVRPIPVYFLFGGADPLSPLAGGFVRRFVVRGERPAVAVSVDKWRRALACRGAPQIERRGLLTRRIWSPCAGGVSLTYIVIDKMGHVWPGAIPSRLPRWLLGAPKPASVRFDATREIWRFFARHQLAGP